MPEINVSTIDIITIITDLKGSFRASLHYYHSVNAIILLNFKG